MTDPDRLSTDVPAVLPSTPVDTLPTLPPVVVGSGLPIHLEDELLAELQKVMADVPEDKRGQVALVVGMTGVTVTTAAKVGDHIQVAAEAGKAWHGAASAGVSVKIGWRP